MALKEPCLSISVVGIGSAAFAGAAGGADEAAFLVDEGVVAAVGAALGGFGTVGDVFLEGSLHAHFPGVDRLAVKLEAVDHLYHLLNGHAVAEHTGDEFGVVPVFGVEFV